MKHGWTIAILVGALASISACGSSSATTTSGNVAAAPTPTATLAPTATVAPTPTQASTSVAAHSSSLGAILVDASGRTLYLWEADKSASSTCYGSCAQAWPPLLATGSPVAGSGVNQSLLGTSSRTDGSTQVTYNGHPLYYFAGDTQPGDTKGQNLHSFGADWYVLAPSGTKIG